MFASTIGVRANATAIPVINSIRCVFIATSNGKTDRERFRQS
jgi:hypothetical protein